jgi:hypothetical protein
VSSGVAGWWLVRAAVPRVACGASSGRVGSGRVGRKAEMCMAVACGLGSTGLICDGLMGGFRPRIIMFWSLWLNRLPELTYRIELNHSYLLPKLICVWSQFFCFSSRPFWVQFSVIGFSAHS